MHLIYSALRDLHDAANKQTKDNSEIQLRFMAFTKACRKHKQYITDIQKHFPDWMPPFR